MAPNSIRKKTLPNGFNPINAFNYEGARVSIPFEYKDGENFGTWSTNFADLNYSNDKHTRDVFNEAVQYGLTDEQFRKLKREVRQDRRKFRKYARKEYHDAKKTYRDDKRNEEKRMKENPNRKPTPVIKPERKRFDDTNVGRARKVGGDYYKQYLATNYARKQADDDLDDRGMRHRPSVGIAYDGKPSNRGVIEYIGNGQDWLDLNRASILSGDQYFAKRAEEERFIRDTAKLKKAQDEYDLGLTRFKMGNRVRALNESGSIIPSSEDAPNWEAEYRQSYGNRPTMSSIPNRDRNTFTDPDGVLRADVSADSDTRINELYGDDIDPRYKFAMQMNPKDLHGVYEKGVLRPYTEKEQYEKFGSWVRTHIMDKDRYYFSPKGYAVRERETWPQKELSHTPEYFKDSAFDYSVEDGQYTMHPKARGGRLPKAPTRDKYGNKIARADNLGTRDYDVYF